MVGFAAALGELRGKIAVGIPASVEELGEADTSFSESAGHEGVVGVGAGFAGIFSVELESGLWLVGKVGEFGNGHLHPVGHFVLGDAGLDFGVEKLVVVDLVEFLEVVEGVAAEVGGDSFGV